MLKKESEYKDNSSNKSNYKEHRDLAFTRRIINKSFKAVDNDLESNKEDQDKDKDNFIYNTGTTVYICNNRRRFISFKPCKLEIKIRNTYYQSFGIENIIIYLTKPLCKKAKKKILLKDVRYVSRFHTNLFSSGIAEKYIDI